MAGGVHGWWACVAGVACVARGHAWMAGGCMAGGWHAWLRGMHGTPLQILRLWHTVNERAVRILLECILFYFLFLLLVFKAETTVCFFFVSNVSVSQQSSDLLINMNYQRVTNHFGGSAKYYFRLFFAYDCEFFPKCFHVQDL